MTLRNRLMKLEQSNGHSPPAPLERCPRCGGRELAAPGVEQLCTLVGDDWTDADLEAAERELADYRHPHRLRWCVPCARVVVTPVGGYDVEVWRSMFWGNAPESQEFRDHLSSRRLLRLLVPCRQWEGCLARDGKTCAGCPGKGRLRFRACHGAE